MRLHPSILLALALSPGSFAQDASKVYLAEFSNNSTLRVVDIDTGVVSDSVTLQLNSPTDFASSPDGAIYATTTSRLHQVDPSTGMASLTGSPGVGGAIVGLEFDCDGGAFIVTSSGVFASVDLSTGQGTPIENFPVAFSGDITTRGGGVFYATFEGVSESRLARIDTSTTPPTFLDLGIPVAGRRLLGLDFDGLGRLIASDDQRSPGNLYEISGFDVGGSLSSALRASVPNLTGPIAGIASFV
ncbi:MAG: hypothetical protein AAGG01_23330, partial [Planctomycetota bacterium]